METELLAQAMQKLVDEIHELPWILARSADYQERIIELLSQLESQMRRHNKSMELIAAELVSHFDTMEGKMR